MRGTTVRNDGELRASVEAIRERLFALASATGADSGGAFTVLMSRIGGEGVTTVTACLARAIARDRLLRVLVIAFDAGKRGAAAMLGVTPKAFAGFGAAEDAPAPRQFVQALEDGFLNVLTVDAAVAIGARWTQALGALAGEYDLVLVDAGSKRNPLPGRRPENSDRVVLVIDSSRTTVEELRRLRAEFDAGDNRPAAVILNKRDYYVPRFLYRYVR